MYRLTPITTTAPSRFNVETWDKQLTQARVHITKPEVYEFIMRGLKEGFTLEGDFSNLTKTMCNLPTTVAEKVKITQWLTKLQKRGILYGPYLRKEVPDTIFAGPLHRSPLGGVWGRTKYRPFVHFSFPRSGDG